MNHLDHTYAVILAGGGGTRLWPKSRTQTPKQFLKLLGDNTLIQQTANRINKLIPWERIIVVTNELYQKDVKEQLPNVPEQNVICEPQKRDTALAMLVGSLFAKNLDPKAVVVNLASDHAVANEAEFIRVITAASQVATESDYLVTVGITPTYPSSGLGYIKIGEDIKKLDHGLTLFKVASFTEKPNEATARGFISTGKYFWNANNYVWNVNTIEQAFQKHMPEMWQQAQVLLELSPPKFHSQLENLYQQAEAIAIDYAISEKADNLVLIPGDFGWDDIGDWKVVYDLEKKNISGNVILGEGTNIHTLSIESHNNLIHTSGRLVAIVGVDDLVVIDTDEILMIVPKSRTQDVKKIVTRLKEEKQKEYL